MKKPYRGIDRQNFKLIIRKESTIVDEKNRRVIHILDWAIVSPDIFNDFIWITRNNDSWKVITGRTKGVAVCHPEDTFNEEIGRKMARAIAESNAYQNASKILRKRMKVINKIVDELDMMSIDFKMKADEIKTHNREYQDSLI